MKLDNLFVIYTSLLTLSAKSVESDGPQAAAGWPIPFLFLGGFACLMFLLQSLRDAAKPCAKGISSQASLDDRSTALTRSASATDDNTIFSGLKKTRKALFDGISGIFNREGPLSPDQLEELHEVLFRADFGVKTADFLVDRLKKRLLTHSGPESQEKGDPFDELRACLVDVFKEVSIDEAQPNEDGDAMHVVLIVGVNGAGKTTTIGKLAHNYKAKGLKTLLCAADTYRAAATEQLEAWAEKMDVPLVKAQQGADPAALAFDAVKSGMARGVDKVIIDTAGRLHNKSNLMEELKKISGSVRKAGVQGALDVWLVVDGTSGQNAFAQAEMFNKTAKLTGLVVTKLDGTSKGGVVFGLSHTFGLPIRFIGVGEKETDLKVFSADDFAQSIISRT